MGYDVTIGKYWINHTYNGYGLCKEIIGMTPNDFDGLPGHLVKLYALRIYNELQQNGKNYQHYLPNDWGSIKSWKKFMHDIIKYCEEYPDETVIVS